MKEREAAEQQTKTLGELRKRLLETQAEAEALQGKTVEELRKMAETLHIPAYEKLDKQQLIGQLILVQAEQEKSRWSRGALESQTLDKLQEIAKGLCIKLSKDDLIDQIIELHSRESMHVLTDSEPAIPPDAQQVGTPPPGKYIRVTVRAHRGAGYGVLARVEAFARQHGLLVMELSGAQRKVVLAGRVASFERAFGVKLARYRLHGSLYRANIKPVRIPATLAGAVERVNGFSTLPRVKAGG